MKNRIINTIALTMVIWIVFGSLSQAEEVMLGTEHSGVVAGLIVEEGSGLKITNHEVVLNLSHKIMDSATYHFNYEGLEEKVTLALPILIAIPAIHDDYDYPVIYQDGVELEYSSIGFDIFLDKNLDDRSIKDDARIEQAAVDVLSGEVKLEDEVEYGELRIVTFDLDLKDKTTTTIKIEYYHVPYEIDEAIKYHQNYYKYYLQSCRFFEDYGDFKMSVIPENKYEWSHQYILNSTVPFENLNGVYVYETEGILDESIEIYTYPQQKLVEEKENNKDINERQDKPETPDQQEGIHTSIFLAGLMIALFMFTLVIIIAMKRHRRER